MSSHLTPHVIVVDGIIGAGKTTFISRYLAPFLTQQGYLPILVPEPVDLWTSSGSLQQFYENPSRRAFQFQCKVFHDRIQSFNQIYQSSLPLQPNHIFILERSIFTDKIFVNVLYQQRLLDTSEYNDYLALHTMWTSLMPALPTLFIYLATPPHQAMEQLKSRARPSETSGVTLRYQQLLRQFHEDFLGRKQDLAVLSLLPTPHRVPILKIRPNLSTQELDIKINNIFPRF